MHKYESLVFPCTVIVPVRRLPQSWKKNATYKSNVTANSMLDSIVQ